MKTLQPFGRSSLLASNRLTTCEGGNSTRHVVAPGNCRRGISPSAAQSSSLAPSATIPVRLRSWYSVSNAPAPRVSASGPPGTGRWWVWDEAYLQPPGQLGIFSCSLRHRSCLSHRVPQAPSPCGNLAEKAWRCIQRCYQSVRIPSTKKLRWEALHTQAGPSYGVAAASAS